MDHADVCSGVTGDHAVGLEGNKPAFIPALGGNLPAFKRIVGVVTVGKRIEIGRQHHAGSHVPIGKDGKGLAYFRVELVNVKTHASITFLHPTIGDVKIVDVLSRARMTDNPPIALVVVRVLVEPERTGRGLFL